MKLGPDLRGATFGAADVEFEGLGEGFVLRPHAADGSYDPNALLPASAEITLAGLKVPGLRELWGFEEVADYPLDASGARLGSIGYRIADPTGPFYWWDSFNSAWAVVGGANEWSPASDLDAHLWEFSLPSSRELVLAAKLSSDAARLRGPRLRQPWFLVEVFHSGVADVETSVQAFLEGEVGGVSPPCTATLAREQKLTATGTALRLRSSFEPVSVLAAYDVAADPHRTTNLLQAAGTPAPTDAGWVVPVTLTQSRPAETAIEVRFTGRCPVSVGLADDELFAAEVPCVGVLEPSVEERLDLSPPGDVEISAERDLARSRPPPIVKQLTFNVFVMVKAGAEADAAALCRGIYDAFCTRPLLFLPTGERLPVFPMGPFESEDIMAKGVLVRRLGVRVVFHDWPMDYEDVPLVDEVRGVLDSGAGTPTEAFTA